MSKWSISEVKSILECAIGEVDAHIPSDVLEDAIGYLDGYEKQKANDSWEKYPDGFY